MQEYPDNSADALHVMIEAKKLAYADMMKHVADPDFAKIPTREMLSKNHAAARAKLVGPEANCAVEASIIATGAPVSAASISVCPGKS